MKEKEFLKEILTPFEEIGYSENMIEKKNVSFSDKKGSIHKAKAILYSSEIRKDLETALIAIQETEDANNPNLEKEINPYKIIGTPIIILAEFKKLKNGNEPLLSIYTSQIGFGVRF